MLLANSPLKKLYFSKKKYFYHYLNAYVNIGNNFCNIKPKHYFFDIPYTRWPLYLCVSIAVFAFYFLLSFKKFAFAMPLALVGLLGIVYFVYCWFSDMVIDSTILGRYNRKVRQSISYGFMLFLVSEIFTFSGFFWGYFDRLFDPSVLTGGTALPYGLEPLFKNMKPVYGTVTLILSGYLANWAVYWTHMGVWTYRTICTDLAIVTGYLFLGIQFMEYSNLLFTISDSVYGSCFYFLTGFHGLHVIIGLTFLMVQANRMYFCHPNKVRLQGYRLSLIYWHFVDYIWIFLFISVYVINWSSSYYHMWNI